MSSSLKVINRGLIRLGVPPLASLSDRSAQSMAADTVYTEIKKAALAEFPWSFALRETDLPELSVPSGQERWSDLPYTYQLPNDVVRVLGLLNYGGYRLTGDQLHTDEKKPRLVYVTNVSESHWPEFFQKVVSFDFAASVAVTLTDEVNRADVMYQQAQLARRTARAIDSQQTPSPVLKLMQIYLRRGYNPMMS